MPTTAAAEILERKRRPMWSTRDISSFERLEQIGEGMYGQVPTIVASLRPVSLPSLSMVRQLAARSSRRVVAISARCSASLADEGLRRESEHIGGNTVWGRVQQGRPARGPPRGLARCSRSAHPPLPPGPACQVYKAVDKQNGKVVALKKIKMNDAPGGGGGGERSGEGFPITALREVACGGAI